MDIEALMEKYGDNILRLCYLYLLSAGWGTGGGRGPGDLCPGLAESGGLSGGIKTWLTSIAVNVCRNMLRSPWHSRRVDLEILERVPAEEREAVDDTVIRAVLGLPGKYREVVVLYYYQDCSTAEIAQALELPQGTVSIRLKRARERLKPALKEWYYAEY